MSISTTLPSYKTASEHSQTCWTCHISRLQECQPFSGASFCVASQFAPSLNVAVRQGRTRRWHNCGIAACTSLPIVWHQAPPVTVALSLLRLAPWFGSFVFPSHATFPPRPRLQLSPAQVRSLHLVTCGLWPSSKKDADRQLRYFALSWELEQNMHLKQSMKVCAMYIPMLLRRSTDQPRLLFCEEICDVILACTKSPFTADPSSLFIFQVVRLFHKNSYLAMDSRKVGYITVVFADRSLVPVATTRFLGRPCGRGTQRHGLPHPTHPAMCITTSAVVAE